MKSNPLATTGQAWRRPVNSEAERRSSFIKLLQKAKRTAMPWQRPPAPMRRLACTSPRVSIIIPIHGTEKYVEKCVLSAMNQSLKEIEILCIDDASPDNSARIVQRLARRDGRIRLIQHQRNLGVGSARNTGIRAARAPYVTGIDSDDFILPEMMQKLWEASENGKADVVACGFTRVHEDGSAAAASYQPQPGWFDNQAHQLDIFEFLNPSFWNKIWKHSLFEEDGIYFPEQTYFEDLAITPQLINKAKLIRVVDGAYYKYFVRAGSITQSYSSRHIIDHFKVFDILDNFLEREGLQQRYRQDLLERISRSLSFHAGEVIASAMPQDEKEQYLRNCLMLQTGYLKLMDQLRNTSAIDLRRLIETAHNPEKRASLLYDKQPV